VSVKGRLRPGLRGRKLALQARERGAWRTIARGRTTSRGRFALHYTPQGLGQEALRVDFAGDRKNAATAAQAGSLTVLEPSVASWYEDAGSTACGFHAYYGVANLSLPCGTQVTFRIGGRQVTATVDDRGPYVGGRTWDLNQNTAAALRFAGVATVLASL
jgi:rare lipoprotein A